MFIGNSHILDPVKHPLWVKHTQTIPWLLLANCFSVFDNFVKPWAIFAKNVYIYNVNIYIRSLRRSYMFADWLTWNKNQLLNLSCVKFVRIRVFFSRYVSVQKQNRDSRHHWPKKKVLKIECKYYIVISLKDCFQVRQLLVKAGYYTKFAVTSETDRFIC